MDKNKHGKPIFRNRNCTCMLYMTENINEDILMLTMSWCLTCQLGLYPVALEYQPGMRSSRHVKLLIYFNIYTITYRISVFFFRVYPISALFATISESRKIYQRKFDTKCCSYNIVLSFLMK